jgi:flagellar hook-basal body complex protein FliE
MMNQEDLFRKLGTILNELNEQYDYLAKNPRSLNELELELFLANSNFLSEHIQIIRKINNNVVFKALPEHSEVQPVVVSSPGETQPEVNEPVNMVIQEPESESGESQDNEDYQSQTDLFKIDQSPASFEFILNDRSQSIEDEVEQSAEHTAEAMEQPEAVGQTDIITEMNKDDEPEAVGFEAVQEETIPKHSEPVVEEPIVTQGQAIEEPVIKQIPVIEKETRAAEPFLIPKAEDRVPETRTTLVEDKVEQKLVKPTLNDLLASSLNKGNPVSEQSAPPIKDLKQAINLNDKLLYIKDLFNGYNLAYAEAIELINKMPDFKTADTFLKSNYAVKNNWSAKQATVDKFYALLERRFS